MDGMTMTPEIPTITVTVDGIGVELASRAEVLSAQRANSQVINSLRSDILDAKAELKEEIAAVNGRLDAIVKTQAEQGKALAEILKILRKD